MEGGGLGDGSSSAVDPVNRPHYGPSTCSVCGVVKANSLAMRRHTMFSHPHLSRNHNRRLPPRQLGPDPGLSPEPLPPTPGTPSPPMPPTAGTPSPPLSPTRPPSPIPPSLAGLFDMAGSEGADDGLLATYLSDWGAQQAAATRQASSAAAPRSAAARPPSRGDVPRHEEPVEALGGSCVSTEARAHYERVGDARRCEPALEQRPRAKPGLFNTPILTELQSLVHDIGGSGASLADQTRIFKFLVKYDEAIAESMKAGVNGGSCAVPAAGGPTTSDGTPAGGVSTNTGTAASGGSSSSGMAASGGYTNNGAKAGATPTNNGVEAGAASTDSHTASGTAFINTSTAAGAEPPRTTDNPGAPFRITHVFRSANAFRNALRDDLDNAVLAAGWKKCKMVQGGVEYVAYFRCALAVALGALRGAGQVQMRRNDDEVGDRREHPIDGEAFKEHQAAIDAISGGLGFVLGVYVYSDASLLSWSGGKSRPLSSFIRFCVHCVSCCLVLFL